MKTLTQGQKGDKVIDSMARTFKTLCDYADWSQPESVDKKETEDVEQAMAEVTQTTHSNANQLMDTKQNTLGLCYNIQIHLPETTNMAVYDAIFASVKKHLM